MNDLSLTPAIGGLEEMSSAASNVFNSCFVILILHYFPKIISYSLEHKGFIGKSGIEPESSLTQTERHTFRLFPVIRFLSFSAIGKYR